MTKGYNRYLNLDEWKIIEEGFHKDQSKVSESVFSLGNEYMGVRGYFEEGASCESLRGSYFNGVYENARELKNTSYKGIVTRTHFLINAVDWLHARIELDGERLDAARSDISGFTRTLDMRGGKLTRRLKWRTKGGKMLEIEFERFLSMEKAAEGYQRICVTPLNFSGDIMIELGLDFSLVHESSQYNYWREIKKEQCGSGAAVIGRTLTTGIRIFSGFSLDSKEIAEKAVRCDDRYIGLKCVVNLTKSEKSTLVKKVVNLVEKDGSVPDEALWAQGMERLRRQAGYEEACREQREYWRRVFDNVDIQIEGDLRRQQGIRYCIFQLQQTYHGLDPRNNIGAKGLTGEAYNGHTFWDTEVYCLPFYLFNHPSAAKNLLEYRYKTLPQAKKRAKELDCEGACFPVATITGDEACDLWQHANLQLQASTGVAYAIRHYVANTGDTDYLYGHGAEMLVEICRFLRSRGSWGGKENKFGFYGVMGPDEFHMMVNNNCYTNYMAKKTFEYTVAAAGQMRELFPEKYSALVQETGLSDREIGEMKHCMENMKIPYDEKTGIYEQHDGYFDLPHINVDEIPVREFPLYNHWSYDRIYRTDMIKQPDVLMLFFLFSHDFSKKTKKNNYEYYEPRTIHESSLSPSIHSVLACELGKDREAFDFFDFATRMDLDNYNRNTGEGLHTTSLAAAWVNIVYGFGGMRSDGELLELNPTIPKEWNSYSFRVVYRGSVLFIGIDQKSLKIRAVNGAEVSVLVYGEKRRITEKGVELPLKSGSRT